MTARKWAQLRDLIDRHALIVPPRPIKLSTGTLSTYYFDCKTVTLNGRALTLIADLFLEKIRELPEIPVAIGGLTMGADFITAAVAMRAFEKGLKTIHGSIVRKEPKGHGTKNRIENELKPGTRIVVVDDVITTGNATRRACDEFISSGYKIVGIIALVDREQGGKADLEKRYGAVHALFKKSDFRRALEADDSRGSNQASLVVAA